MAVKLRPPGGDERDILARDHPGVRRPHARGLPRAAAAAPPRPRDGPAGHGEARRLPRRPPRGADRRRRRRSAPSRPPASRPSPTTPLTPSSSSPRTAPRPGSGTAGAPRPARRRLPDDEARDRGRDYLCDELDERLRDGPGALRAPPPDPRGRRSPRRSHRGLARRARAASRPGASRSPGSVDDPECDEHIDVFDPTRVADGIELSDDPILHARARAYSVSAYRRLGVEVEHPSQPPGGPTA